MSLAHGRDLIAIPGPSVIPDRVLRAMQRPAPDIYGAALIDLTHGILDDLRRVARTSGDPVIYIGNGHAAWEAAIANTLAPGHKALVAITGRFGSGWAATARQMGVIVEEIDFGFHGALDPSRITDRLSADKGHTIRAVLAVHTDTASSAHNDIPALRAALDAAGHPALLQVDCIASLGIAPFEMDAWGVDVMLAASQKGLMTPAGLGFTFHNAKAAAMRVACPSPYWDWGPRVDPEIFYQRFGGTPPTHHLFALRAALDMLLTDEGLDAAWIRHATLAQAVWAAVSRWGEGSSIRLNVPLEDERSPAVTTIRMASGDAARLRQWTTHEAGLTLGVGMAGPGDNPDDLFRIGHMGHLNPPMLLGTLATIEAGLVALDVKHAPGGVEAAARVMAGASRPIGQ